MLNIFEVSETNNMIDQEKLDVRTITMGISLLDCCDSDLNKLNEKIYEKITRLARIWSLQVMTLKESTGCRWSINVFP